MKIGAPKEIFENEARVAMTPDSALQLQKLGYECVIEAGAGARAGFTDAAYKEAGVEVVKTAAALYKAADIIAKVRPPSEAEVKKLSKGQLLISFFYPGQNEKLLELAKSKGANVIAMDMVPRISRAQKMDALSSMANIAGYRAVIEAGNNFGRFFTGQVTAAGKVPPAKVSGRRGRRRRSCSDRDVDVAGRDHLCVRRAPRSGRADRIRWAPNSCSSNSRQANCRMVPRPAAMRRPPARNSRPSSLPSSVNWHPRSISSSPRRSFPAVRLRSSGPKTWSR